MAALAGNQNAHVENTTGCLTVRVPFDTPSNFLLGAYIAKSFYVVKVGGLRFCLVYNMPW